MVEIWRLVTFDRGTRHPRWHLSCWSGCEHKARAKAGVRIKPSVQDEQTWESQSAEQSPRNKLDQSPKLRWMTHKEYKVWREYKLPPKHGLPSPWDFKDLLPVPQLSSMFGSDSILLNCPQVVYIWEAEATTSICLCFLGARWPLALFLSLSSLLLPHPHPPISPCCLLTLYLSTYPSLQAVRGINI